MKAMEEADVVMVVFDGRAEPGVLDEELILYLRKLKRPVIWVANKIDVPRDEKNLVQYYKFGLGKIFPVSAEHGLGIDLLLDQMLSCFPEEIPFEDKTKGRKIAVVGKPNVGKSTFINYLAGENRCVVHNAPGTTRDAIDVEIVHKEKSYTFVDTAGIKKGYRLEQPLEKNTAFRSLRAIERSDIVCQLIDATHGMTKQDLHLTGYAHEQGKAVALLVNKWDLMEKPWPEFQADLEYQLRAFGHIKMLKVSAKTGQGCVKVFHLLDVMDALLSKKISTSKLNAVLEETLAAHHLPVYRSKSVKINYVTQMTSYPPTFLFYSNCPEGIPEAYKRYVIHAFEEAFGFKGVPIRAFFRRKN